MSGDTVEASQSARTRHWRSNRLDIRYGHGRWLHEQST
jgi:hypothetical protein